LRPVPPLLGTDKGQLLTELPFLFSSEVASYENGLFLGGRAWYADFVMITIAMKRITGKSFKSTTTTTTMKITGASGEWRNS